MQEINCLDLNRNEWSLLPNDSATWWWSRCILVLWASDAQIGRHLFNIHVIDRVVILLNFVFFAYVRFDKESNNDRDIKFWILRLECWCLWWLFFISLFNEVIYLYNQHHWHELLFYFFISLYFLVYMTFISRFCFFFLGLDHFYFWLTYLCLLYLVKFFTFEHGFSVIMFLSFSFSIGILLSFLLGKKRLWNHEQLLLHTFIVTNS